MGRDKSRKARSPLALRAWAWSKPGAGSAFQAQVQQPGAGLDAARHGLLHLGKGRLKAS